jgi:hypothetical protein
MKEQNVSHLAAFERLPRNVFSDIVINPTMERNVTDPELRRWLNPEYLLHHAAVFTVAGRHGELLLPQAPTMKRGVILETTNYYFDEYENPYSMVTAKGSGFSFPDVYERKNVEEIEETPEQCRSFGWIAQAPWGLFSEADAETERIVPDAIAAEGGRVGRVIGNLIFDHAQLRRWYKNHEQHSYVPLDKQLDIVEQKGNTAALCIRLLAADRLEDYPRVEVGGYYSGEKIITRAARLLQAEIERKSPEGFSQQYHIDDPEESGRTIDTLLRGVRNEAVYADYAALLYHLYLLTYTAIQKAAEGEFNGTLFKQFSRQDFDFAGYMYDWELSLPGEDNIVSYTSDSHYFKFPLVSDELNKEILAAAERKTYMFGDSQI